MPRRVIKGSTYDTDTAQHIATAVGRYSRDEDTGLNVSRDVYRTWAGAFFLVDCIESLRDMTGVTTVVETMTIFFPLSYDQALAFVRGEDFVVTDIRLGLRDMPIDILDESIFPPVPETTAEDVGKDYEDREKDEDED